MSYFPPGSVPPDWVLFRELRHWVKHCYNLDEFYPKWLIELIADVRSGKIVYRIANVPPDTKYEVDWLSTRDEHPESGGWRSTVKDWDEAGVDWDVGRIYLVGGCQRPAPIVVWWPSVVAWVNEVLSKVKPILATPEVRVRACGIAAYVPEPAPALSTALGGGAIANQSEHPIKQQKNRPGPPPKVRAAICKQMVVDFANNPSELAELSQDVLRNKYEPIAKPLRRRGNELSKTTVDKARAEALPKLWRNSGRTLNTDK